VRLPAVIVLVLLLLLHAGGEALGWVDLSAETRSASVPARSQHALAVAPDGALYLYGGVGPDRVFLNDLWRLEGDGSAWEPVEPSDGIRPPPLAEPHVVVLADGDVLEFGGLHPGHRLSNGLYRFDADGQRWHDLSASAEAAGVPPRQDHGWVLDPVSQQVYLFGGDGDGEYLHDFWRYDAAADVWVDLSLPSRAGALAPRELYNLSYDNHGGLFLFGGTNEYGRLNDFWRYDIAAGYWVDLTEATGSRAVPGRHYYGQATDAAGNFYVLGGWKSWSWADQTSSVADDFWKFDAAASAWVQADRSIVEGLLPRIPYVAVFRPGPDRLLGFGGAVPGRPEDPATLVVVGDTWSLPLDGAFPALPPRGGLPESHPPPRLVMPALDGGGLTEPP
jgi:hypothetical protein